MERVERPQRHRIKERSACTDALARLDDGDLRDDSLRLRDQLRHGTTYRADDLDLDDGARDLVWIATSLTSAEESR